MISFFDLLKHGKNKLSTITPDAELESEIMLLESFSISKAWLIANLATMATNKLKINQFHKMITKRCQRIPLSYIIKKAVFQNHCYTILPGVLIPRPETELLVEHCIKIINKTRLNHDQLIIIEVGFGSGIIGIELALLFPTLPIHAWDTSKKAHKVATINANDLQAKNITFYCADFFKDQTRFQSLIKNKTVILISNPPYIPTHDIQTLEPEVKNHEPKTALDGGITGLTFYKKFSAILQKIPNSIGIFEFGIHQKPQLEKIFTKEKIASFEFKNDLQNIPRIATIMQN